MTFIAGYKRSNTIHLIADSAITMEGNNLPTLPVKDSAFGNLHIDGTNEQVHTLGLKLTRLSGKAISAYAGNVRRAVMFLNDLQYRLRLLSNEHLNIESIISNLLTEYRCPEDVSFIFGIVHEGESILLSYNDRLTRERRLNRIEEFTFSGNTDDDFNSKFGAVMLGSSRSIQICQIPIFWLQHALSFNLQISTAIKT